MWASAATTRPLVSGASSSMCTASPRSSLFSSSGVPCATILPWSTIASAARQPVGLLEVVRGEQDREPLLAGEALDLGPHVGARLGVEAGRRLVEEQHLGTVHEPDGDVELALHAARVGARDAARRVGSGRSARAGCRRARSRARPPMPYSRPCSSMFSRPVACTSTPDFCATQPMARRTRSGRRSTSMPATTASPWSGRDSVVRILTVVDLPAPLGPTRPKTVPASTSKLTPSSARTPLG